MAVRPAAENTGIRFVRSDLGGLEIPALWDRVVDTRLCTMIGATGGATVGTIEHLMAALRGCDVDNAVIELDGPEVPVMDGSAAPFVFLIEAAGTVEQAAPRRAIEVLKRVTVTGGDRVATLEPAVGSSYSFEIDFPSKAIARQSGRVDLTDGAFRREISKARTFGFLHEVEQMRKAGLARGGSLDNAIVIAEDKVMNAGGLRYRDEFVRHKILDSIGDLFLAGAPLIAHYHGYKAGHAINNQVLHALFADASAWRWIEVTEAHLTGTWTHELLRVANG